MLLRQYNIVAVTLLQYRDMGATASQCGTLVACHGERPEAGCSPGLPETIPLSTLQEERLFLGYGRQGPATAQPMFTLGLRCDRTESCLWCRLVRPLKRLHGSLVNFSAILKQTHQPITSPYPLSSLWRFSPGFRLPLAAPPCLETASANPQSGP